MAPRKTRDGGGRRGRNNRGGGWTSVYPDRSRSPVGRDRSPSQPSSSSAPESTPTVPNACDSTVPNRARSSTPPSTIRQFIEDYKTLGANGKRLLFKLCFEAVAEWGRSEPPRTSSPHFDRVTRDADNWSRKTEEEKRAFLRPHLLDFFVMVRRKRPPGSIGIVSQIAHNWETTPELDQREFLDCLNDGPTQVWHVFLELPEETKDLLRRLG